MPSLFSGFQQRNHDSWLFSCRSGFYFGALYAAVRTHLLRALPPAKPESLGDGGFSVGFIGGDHVNSSKVWRDLEHVMENYVLRSAQVPTS